MLFCQVKDDDRALSLGSLTVPLMRLLASPELTMDQWFQLENSGPASRIYIKTVLRVCIPHTLQTVTPQCSQETRVRQLKWSEAK